MTLVELKKSLHEKIDHINDAEMLAMVDGLIRETQVVFTIPQDHLAGIEQGAKDIQNGDFITLNDFEKRYQKWLKD